MSQNRSTAVMQRRIEAHDSLDDFPTPPWATRALCEFLSNGPPSMPLDLWSCREPAANRGHMVKPLAEYFAQVDASDVHDYGVGFPVEDYLFGPLPHMTDWTITNPPFRLAGQFIERALATSRKGVAMIVRSAFLEGQERHEELFARFPPAYVLQFVERCLMLRGRIIRVGAPDPFNLKDGEPVKGATATSYCWIVWIHGETDTRLRWLPAVRQGLEKPGDYPAYAEQWAAIAPPAEANLFTKETDPCVSS